MTILIRLFCVIYFLGIFKANAAVMSGSISQSTQLSFGKIAPGATTIGSIGSSLATCSPLTGGITQLGNCSNGLFSFTTKNGGSSVTSGKRDFLILVPNASITSITTNDTVLNFPTSGFSGGTCTVASSPIPSGYKGLKCTNSATKNTATQAWTIPIVGALSNINPLQNGGTYNPSYTITICSCNNGCPTSITNAKCIATKGKNLSTTLTVRIYKSLSIVAGTNLNFGSVVSGSAPGTIDQSGTATGGVTAVGNIATRSTGKFTVSGEPENGIPYSFSLPSSVTLTGPGQDMTASLTFSTGTNIRTLDSSGQDIVNVNGVLTVNANQTKGSYTGVYNVFVNY